LTPAEAERFRDLESRLLGLFHPEEQNVRRSFQFDAGPVIVICPTAPQTSSRTTTAVMADDFSSHAILLGGIGWNKVAARFQGATGQVPIEQTLVDDVVGGDTFKVQARDGPQSLHPEYEGLGDGKELIADVGYLARLRNAFQHSRTLTICNGIHTRGVFGDVRCLTDARVREANERYLAERFPNGEFAILPRVPGVENQTLSPDLHDPSARLYEWSRNRDGVQ
jgi:hypothetical protein